MSRMILTNLFLEDFHNHVLIWSHFRIVLFTAAPALDADVVYGDLTEANIAWYGVQVPLYSAAAPIAGPKTERVMTPIIVQHDGIEDPETVIGWGIMETDYNRLYMAKLFAAGPASFALAGDFRRLKHTLRLSEIVAP